MEHRDAEHAVSTIDINDEECRLMQASKVEIKTK